MEPRPRAVAGVRRHRWRARWRRTPGSVRPLVAGAAPLRPIRLGAPAPLEPPARLRLRGWLAVSVLLHCAGLSVALAWISQHETVSIEPIPIAWVRVEAGEAGGGGSDALAPAALPAGSPPAERPAEPRRVRERRPPQHAPSPAPIGALANATEDPPTPGSAAAPDGASPVAETESAAASTVGVGTDTGDHAGRDRAGAGGGLGVGYRSVGSGVAPGWMPHGGVQPPPSYPDAARRRGTEGTAHVAIRLAASGLVDEARLHRSAGDAQLDGAALAAVRRWRFDAPPPGADWSGLWFVVPIEFRLR